MMDRQAIEALVAAGIMRLPVPLMRALNGTPTAVDGKTLEPRTQFLLNMQERSGRPGFGELGVDETRVAFDGMRNGLGPGARVIAHVNDRVIEGPGGDVPLRIYSPHVAANNAPALVFYHGGGWVIGNIETHDDICRALACAAECVVISVDYRLAPEHCFPAAADDALAAYRWVRDHSSELGVDASRIAVGGDSAGGNLAAVVSQDTKNDDVPICFQLLIYPVTDLRCASASHESFADGFFLTRQAMLWFRGHYLADESAIEDPRVSPLLAEDLSGLPPAFVATAGFDPLRDEGRAYAEKLGAAGVSVSYRCYEGTIHGCLSLSGVIPPGRAMLDDCVGALRGAFSRVAV
jgi:acetyl esterase